MRVAAGWDSGEAREHVLGLYGAQGDVVCETNINSTTAGHRKCALRGQWSASSRAIGNRNGAGMDTAGENLREDRDSSFLAECKARAK